MNFFTKILLTLFVFLYVTQSFAQHAVVTTGLNLSNILLKDDYFTYSKDNSMKPGFHIGAMINFPITDMISVEPGILFETKGFKIKDSALGVSGKVTTNLYYVDIPLMARADYNISDNLKVYGSSGPYAGMGLVGNVKTVIAFLGDKETDKEKIKWGNDEDDDDLKRFDFGWKFGAGVGYNKLQAGISFDLGLANISPFTEDGTKAKNRVLRFSVGYILGED